MNRKAVQSTGELAGTHVSIRVPVTDLDVFSHDATGAILNLLVDNPDRSFSNRELHRLTGKGLGNVNAAVRDLETLGVVTVDRDGRANQVRIDPSKVASPDDPTLAIPQEEFHEPVRAIVDRLTERIDDPGIILFGSVARGDADRASDIDLFVVVEEDRMASQRAAHDVEREIASERFGGDRYEAHVVVQRPESAVTHDRIRMVLTEGITLRETSILNEVTEQVLANGAE